MFEEIITIVNESDMNSTVPTNNTNQSTYACISKKRSGWIWFKNNHKFERPTAKTNFEKWVP